MANTLYEYFEKQGQSLPSLSERKKKYNLGDDYRGTAAQNAALLNSLNSGKYSSSSNSSSGGGASDDLVNTSRNVNTNIGGKVTVDPDEYRYDKFTAGQLGSSDRVLDSLIDQATSRFEEEPDYDDIRRETEKKFRKEIRSIERSYNDLLNTKLTQMQPELDNRVGRQVATASRGGLVGSARGNAQAAEVDRYNTQLQQNVTAEVTAARDAELASLFGQIREYSQAEFARQEEAFRQGGEQLLEYLGQAQERKSGIVNNVIAKMIEAGIDVDSLSENEIARFAQDMNIDVADLNQMIPQAKDAYAKSQAEGNVLSMIQKGERDPVKIATSLGLSLSDVDSILDMAIKDPEKLSQGQRLIDPLTGKTIAYNPKTYAPSSGGGGNYVLLGEQKGSFDDYLDSDDLASKASAQEAKLGRSMTDEELMSFAQSAYDSYTPANQTKYKVTNSELQDIQRAGLSNGSGNTQSYFLSLPSSFRDYWNSLVASGDASFGAGTAEIQSQYQTWKEEKDSSASESLEDLFGAYYQSKNR